MYEYPDDMAPRQTFDIFGSQANTLIKSLNNQTTNDNRSSIRKPNRMSSR